MNKKLLEVINRGSGYIFRKAIYKADSVYRGMRKRIYMSSLACHDAKTFKNISYNNKIVSEEFTSDDFINFFKKSSYYSTVIDMADNYVNDKMLLFGKWICIPYIGNDYPWNYDFINNHLFESVAYTKIKIKPSDYEIKIPWELGRMQQLPILALAWLVTADSSYFNKLRWIISNYNECIPIGYGVQWLCGMEVAIRIYNILVAYALIYQQMEENDELHLIIRKMAYDHLKYLMNNLETNAHLHANNHYLADLLGIIAVSCEFGFLECKKYLNFAKRELEREIRRQITDDGINIEMSTAYTRLDAEILLYSAIMLERSGLPVSDDYRIKLLRMGDFLDCITIHNELSLQLGDNDCGRILILTDRDVTSYRYISELIRSFLGQRHENLMPNMEQIVAFGIIKTDAINNYINVKKENIYFPESEIACFHKKRYDLFFSNTNTYIYDTNGHKHNDNLSFELYVSGKPVFVDPGTGFYTSNVVLRNILRSNKSHNTFYIDNQECNEFVGTFGMINNIRNNDMQVRENIAVASHDGYYSKYGIYCSRKLECRDSEIVITDCIKKPDGGIWCGEIEWNFTLHPEVTVLEQEDQKHIVLMCGSKKVSIISELELMIGDAWYSSNYYSVCDTKCIRAKAYNMEKAVITISII